MGKRLFLAASLMSLLASAGCLKGVCERHGYYPVATQAAGARLLCAVLSAVCAGLDRLCRASAGLESAGRGSLHLRARSSSIRPATRSTHDLASVVLIVPEA